MSLKNADKFGVIDIGSNTVRGVLYGGGENPTALNNIAFQSDILKDTFENKLSAEGIFNLCSSIEKIKKEFGMNKNIFAFATSAMRDVNNFSDVFETVKEKTGVEIELISGDKEAEYDYLALRSVNNEEYGIGVDLGGGSAQVVAFEGEELKEFVSMPIGVKRVRNMFCKDVIPNKEEISEIEKYIAEQLYGIKARNKNIWFMGGTAKAIAKAAKKLQEKDEVTPEIIDALFEITSNNIPLLMNIFKYDTMPVGFVVMKNICTNLGGERIYVTDAGVRDGYVMKLTEGRNND